MTRDVHTGRSRTSCPLRLYRLNFPHTRRPAVGRPQAFRCRAARAQCVRHARHLAGLPSHSCSVSIRCNPSMNHRTPRASLRHSRIVPFRSSTNHLNRLGFDSLSDDEQPSEPAKGQLECRVPLKSRLVRCTHERLHRLALQRKDVYPARVVQGLSRLAPYEHSLNRCRVFLTESHRLESVVFRLGHLPQQREQEQPPRSVVAVRYLQHFKRRSLHHRRKPDWRFITDASPRGHCSALAAQFLAHDLFPLSDSAFAVTTQEVLLPPVLHRNLPLDRSVPIFEPRRAVRSQVADEEFRDDMGEAQLSDSAAQRTRTHWSLSPPPVSLVPPWPPVHG